MTKSDSGNRAVPVCLTYSCPRQRSAFGSRYAANNPSDEPKKHYGSGIQRDIKHDAHRGYNVTKQIVFVAVSHNDDESGWP
jgi:hypothetical protein